MDRPSLASNSSSSSPSSPSSPSSSSASLSSSSLSSSSPPPPPSFADRILAPLGFALLVLLVAVISYSFAGRRRRRLAAHSGHGASPPEEEEEEEDGGDGDEAGAGLSEAAILSYPKLLYSNAQLPRGNPSECCCSICLAEYGDSDVLRLLPGCDHYFHLRKSEGAAGSPIPRVPAPERRQLHLPRDLCWISSSRSGTTLGSADAHPTRPRPGKRRKNRMMIHGNLDFLPERAVTQDAADEILHALLDQRDSRRPRAEGPEGVSAVQASYSRLETCITL
ncbi:hypothetical protein NL676_004922 [Syzygium grande]|nr:hypothetical protein NL676_004922 [Syzygium grande]